MSRKQTVFDSSPAGGRIKPMIFNTGMVRALLAGRKTVTRRVVKLKYSNTHLEMRTDKYGTRLIELQNEEPGVTSIKNPDGTTTHTLLAAREVHAPCRPGDVLYVRETWRLVDFDCIDTDWSASVQYKADMAKGDRWHDLSPDERIGWRPSIHMPREAARIWLRVTDVRVERLQEMSAMDATNEGAPSPHLFPDIWDSTVKPADREKYGWAANPWVWVIAFERCERPEE